MQARFHFLQQAGHVKGQVRPVAIDGKLLGMQHHLLAHPLGVLPPEIVERHGGVVLRRLGFDGADAQFSRSVSERLRDGLLYTSDAADDKARIGLGLVCRHYKITNW